MTATMLAALTFSACTSNESQKASGQGAEQEAEQVTETMDSTLIDPAHNSQNALDWSGTYQGVVPCADCPGIETTIVINPDETFSYSGEYLERDLIVEDNGKFMWHDNGSSIHLVGKDVNLKLKVGENQLMMLDQEGNIIQSELKDHYTLTKKISCSSTHH